jgi:hypothetical protein
MSNYDVPPTINDTCMVCFEIYSTMKNIHIPTTCVHHICKKCAKRCKECPYCKKPYKSKKEKTPAQCMIKHIYFMRKNLYHFAKMVESNRNNFGNHFDIHYNSMIDQMTNHIVLMEKQLQDMLPVRERFKRRQTLLNHPYNSNHLHHYLITFNLVPEIENL